MNTPSEELIKQVMQEMGRKGGSAKTEAKKKAAAENGKKGGRPKGKIVTRGKTEEECRQKLFNRLGKNGDITKSVYGHYGDQFMQELRAEYDGNEWRIEFSVGKPKKDS